MANISVASVCNRQCKYCFAMETLDEKPSADKFMTMDVFEQALALVVRSGLDEVRLLGGEPTLHPEFPLMVQMVRERGLRLMVFSGGIIPERSMQVLEAMEPDDLSILLNVAVPGEDRQYEVDRQPDTMRRLGPRITLGINIHSPSVKLDFLLDLINEYDLDRVIRLGISHPIVGGSNHYLRPNEYPEVGDRIFEFFLNCRESDVELDFDCGFVPCMFPAGALEEMEIPAAEMGQRCTPIIDILSDGQVISCYPLAEHHVETIPETADIGSLYQRFADAQSSWRPLTLYQKCFECHWYENGDCTGGGLCASMSRLRSRSFSFRMDGEPANAPEPSNPLTVLNAETCGENYDTSQLLPVIDGPAGTGCCGDNPAITEFH